jgi:hypothetical protein
MFALAGVVGDAVACIKFQAACDLHDEFYKIYGGNSCVFAGVCCGQAFDPDYILKARTARRKASKSFASV